MGYEKVRGYDEMRAVGGGCGVEGRGVPWGGCKLDTHAPCSLQRSNSSTLTIGH